MLNNLIYSATGKNTIETSKLIAIRFLSRRFNDKSWKEIQCSDK